MKLDLMTIALGGVCVGAGLALVLPKQRRAAVSWVKETLGLN